jgi:hypothetical protein
MNATTERPAAASKRPASKGRTACAAPEEDLDTPDGLRAWHRRMAALKAQPIDPAVDPVLVAEKARRGMRP